MNKVFMTAILITLSSISYAENETSCASVLCLSGGLASKTGFQECSVPISTYANIRVYDSHHRFNETLTAIARDNYLRQCSTADSTFISNITMMYGRIENLDINL